MRLARYTYGNGDSDYGLRRALPARARRHNHARPAMARRAWRRMNRRHVTSHNAARRADCLDYDTAR